jgi:hypothetical protein
MTSRDWFGVATRVLGRWEILRGFFYFLNVIADRNGWFTNSTTDPKYYSLYAAAELGAGLILLLGADLIVRVSYSVAPKPPEKIETSTAE